MLCEHGWDSEECQSCWNRRLEKLGLGVHRGTSDYIEYGSLYHGDASKRIQEFNPAAHQVVAEHNLLQDNEKKTMRMRKLRATRTRPKTSREIVKEKIWNGA